MALRHVYPKDEEDRTTMAFGKLTVPRVYAAPEKVEFRRGADLKRLAQRLLSMPSAMVEAAPGAGKSVMLPAALKRSGDVLVYHVFPSRLLAYDIFSYISRTQDGVEPLFVDDVTTELPTRAWLFMSAATFAARAVAKTFTRGKRTILYQDEVHESDAYTYVVKALGRNFAVDNFIMATATVEASGHRVPELPGSVTRVTYPAEMTPDVWDAFDKGQPWSVSGLTGNILLFVDHAPHARRILGNYAEAGLIVHHLTSRMSVDSFARAMSDMRDKRKGLVALVADYSFRSGFTFDVNTIIDTAMVTCTRVKDGVAERYYRSAFSLERFQGSMRGGRLRDLKTVYYSPDDKPREAIVDLDGVELDAAAVMFRALGYFPMPELRASVFARGAFPTALSVMLNSSMPLVVQSADLLTQPPLAAPAAVKSLKSGDLNGVTEAVRRAGSIEQIQRAVSAAAVETRPPAAVSASTGMLSGTARSVASSVKMTPSASMEGRAAAPARVSVPGGATFSAAPSVKVPPNAFVDGGVGGTPATYTRVGGSSAGGAYYTPRSGTSRGSAASSVRMSPSTSSEGHGDGVPGHRPPSGTSAPGSRYQTPCESPTSTVFGDGCSAFDDGPGDTWGECYAEGSVFEPPVPEFPGCYAVVGIGARDIGPSKFFPRGFESVMSMLSDFPDSVHSWSNRERREALVHLVMRSNVMTAESQGLTAALSTMPRELKKRIATFPLVRDWVLHALERVRALGHTIQTIHRAVYGLQVERAYVYEIEPLVAIVDEFMAQYEYELNGFFALPKVEDPQSYAVAATRQARQTLGYRRAQIDNGLRGLTIEGECSAWSGIDSMKMRVRSDKATDSSGRHREARACITVQPRNIWGKVVMRLAGVPSHLDMTIPYPVKR